MKAAHAVAAGDAHSRACACESAVVCVSLRARSCVPACVSARARCVCALVFARRCIFALHSSEQVRARMRGCVRAQSHQMKAEFEKAQDDEVGQARAQIEPSQPLKQSGTLTASSARCGRLVAAPLIRVSIEVWNGSTHASVSIDSVLQPIAAASRLAASTHARTHERVGPPATLSVPPPRRAWVLGRSGSRSRPTFARPSFAAAGTVPRRVASGATS